MQIETRLSGNHTSAPDSRSEAIDWARGGCGDHFGLFNASLRGQAAELEASAGQPRASLKKRFSKALQEIRPGRYNQDTTMAGRYGAEVYIRGTVVLLHHSATTLGGDHTSRHIEKKHYQRDERKNRLL